MSSLKLLFTSGLLCCSNSSVILESAPFLYFFFFFCRVGSVANGKYRCSPAELRHFCHWNITCLHTSSVFPNAFSGTDTLILTFLVDKLQRNGSISGWYYDVGGVHIHASPFPNIFCTTDKRPLITVTHCHLHHTDALTGLINQHSQKTDANEQLANKVARCNVNLWCFLSHMIMQEMNLFNLQLLFISRLSLFMHRHVCILPVSGIVSVVVCFVSWI